MIVAFAGNRIDSPNRAKPRFPPEHATWVRTRITRLLTALRPTLVVGAASAGSDILILEAAAFLQIPARVILPLPPEAFRTVSVVDCGSEWSARFDRIMADLPTGALEWSPRVSPDEPRVFEDGNAAILESALSTSHGETVMAVVVRPKDGKDAVSVTDDFVERSRARGVEVIELDPRLRRSDMRTAFIVMPYGTKADSRGNLIDCESTFSKVVVPALETQDLDWGRADQQVDAGIIHVGMLDRLARSDVVVVDTATENPNAFYELGARHVLCPETTILIAPEGARAPFNVNMVRRIGYRVTGSAVTDADAVDAIRRLRPFLEPSTDEKREADSPLYQLFKVQPPVVEVSHSQDSLAIHLHRRIDVCTEIGGLRELVLDVETAELSRLQRAELLLRIGVRLREGGAYDEAVQVLRSAEVSSQQPVLYGWWCQQTALALRRAGEVQSRAGGDPETRWGEAERLLTTAIDLVGDDAEICGIAGGLSKRRALRVLQSDSTRIGNLRASAFLDKALNWYVRGFKANPSNYYTGVNVLTLETINVLMRPTSSEMLPDEVATLTKFYAERSSEDTFWQLATLAELVLNEHIRRPDDVPSDAVITAYLRALAVPNSADCLQPVRDQLDLFRLTGLDANGTVALILQLPEFEGES